MTDHEEMMLCSLRYGLGRMTYITGTISDYIIKHLPNSSEKFRMLVMRDIEESHSLGMECDKEALMKLYDSIQGYSTTQFSSNGSYLGIKIDTGNRKEEKEFKNKILEWGDSSTGKYVMDKNEIIINELTGFLFSFSGTEYKIPHDEIIKKLKSLL